MLRIPDWFKSRKRATAYAVVLSVCLVNLALIALVPADWETSDPETGAVKTITLFRFYTPIAATLAVWAIVSPIVALLMGMICLKHWWVRLVIPVVFAPLALFALLFAIANNLGPWTTHGEVTAPDGSRFSFLNSSFLQGQTMAIARRERRSIFLDHYSVLVETNGDSPRACLPIVRPEHAVDEYGQLYLTRTGYLIGIRADNSMFMAYDLSARKGYGNPNVENLSPFICIGPKTRLHLPDVASVMSNKVGGRAGDGTHRFARDAIVSALQHPNAEVRRIARNLLNRRDDDTASSDGGH